MLRCGMGEVVMTPLLGDQIPGSVSERFVSGIKDDLYAKALVMEIDQQLIAFVTLDAIDVPRHVVLGIRDKASRMTGIPALHINVMCTHAHTTGPTIRTSYVHAVDELYQNWIIHRAADAVALAYQCRREAQIGFGLGQEQDIAFNRRFYMKDGTVRTNPGIGNPDIIRPTGPIDPDVAVLRIDDLEGRPIGIVTNYACHADTVGGSEISGDYPGEMSEVLKRIYGDHIVSMFWQGASGNINHVDVSGKFPREKGHHYKKMGRILAGEVMKVREKIVYRNGLTMQMKIAYVTVNFRKPSPEEMTAAQQVLQAEQEHKMNEVKFARQAVELAQRGDETVDVEIQVFAMGDVAIVNLPAEMFVEFGLKIKQESPFELTIVNELSNGSVSGYVCTQEAFRQTTGYENRLRKYSRLQVEAGDLFVDQALLLLNELKAEQG